MPKSKLPHDVFPPLELSAKEQQAIVNYSDEVVAETLQASEGFVAHHRRLNPDRWKHLTTKDHLHVYRSRERSRRKSSTPERPYLLSASEVSATSGTMGGMGAGTSVSVGSNGSSESATAPSRKSADYLSDESLLNRARPANVPLVLVTGQMDGTVEDAALGALADNETRWRLRNAYLGDEYDNVKVLATLQSPSAEDPFRFLGVKWMTKTFGTFVSQRDLLFVESMGLALDSTGKRVVYHLMHSYALERVPELSDLGVIRAHSSTCFIMRARRGGSEPQLEVFCRAFSDMGTLDRFADSLLTCSGLVQCSYVKKLKWQLSVRENEARERATAAAACQRAPTHCAGCSQSLRKLVSLMQVGHACQVCRGVFCGKCSGTKKMAVDLGPENGVARRPMHFCHECVQKAAALEAWDVALATLPSQRQLSRATSATSSARS